MPGINALINKRYRYAHTYNKEATLSSSDAFAIILVNFIVIQFAPGSVEQTIAQIQGISVDATTHNRRRKFGLTGVSPDQKASLSKEIWTLSIEVQGDLTRVIKIEKDFGFDKPVRRF